MFFCRTWYASICVNAMGVEIKIDNIPHFVFLPYHGELWIKALRAKRLLLFLIAALDVQSQCSKQMQKQSSFTISMTMVGFVSMLWEQKISVAIYDCFIGYIQIWELLWVSQKQKQSFSASRALIQSSPLWCCSGCSVFFVNIVFLFSASQFWLLHWHAYQLLPLYSYQLCDTFLSIRTLLSTYMNLIPNIHDSTDEVLWWV